MIVINYLTMNKLELPALPYKYDALQPVISQKIMELHHDKHHLAYVTGANAAMEKLEKSRKGELEINVREVLRDYSFNYNGHLMHQLFWQNMRPAMENNKPSPKMEAAIRESFGSGEAFMKEFSNAAITVEGSGWATLSLTDNGLSIGQLEKHNLLGINGSTPLLVLDVWEHAYYLDYLNDRKSYVEKWWSVVNWEDVESRYQLAKSK